MMEKSKLRKADFVTSILLIVFAVWVLMESFTMPINDSFLGVESTWYTSPAFFPIMISIALLGFGILLLINSIRTGGAASFFKDLKNVKQPLSDTSVRFLVIVLAIGLFIYLYIPRVDFILSIIMFLVFTMSVYYFEDIAFLKKFALIYVIISAAFILLFVSGLGKALNSVFMYSTDVLALGVIIAFYIISANWVKLHEPEINRKKFRLILILSIIVPLILAPTFRYFLRVPLPHEGGIINIMHAIYYGLR